MSTPAKAHGPAGVRALGHREYVGGHWDRIGRLQYAWLLRQGLQPKHYLLDIGCGSLRAGRYFIPYLDPGHYLGIDKERDLLAAGLRHELDPAVAATKRPRLVVADNFDFDQFGQRPDVALAHSVFTHLPACDIRTCLQRLGAVIRPGGVCYATFFERRGTVANPPTPHDHRAFYYARSDMLEYGRDAGWDARYIGAWNHPRGQVMVEYRSGGDA